MDGGDVVCVLLPDGQSGAATRGARGRLRKMKFSILTGPRSRKHCTTPGPQGKLVVSVRRQKEPELDDSLGLCRRILPPGT